MKTRTFMTVTIAAFGCSSLFHSCIKAKKNPEDYYAVVSTSAKINTDGNVDVTADISSRGAGALDYVGFCMDTIPDPPMDKNQRIVTELNGDSYAFTYTNNFNPAKTYFFRSWVTNSYGYSYGNTVALANIKAQALVVPCTLNKNSSSIGTMSSGSGPANSVYDVTSVDHFSSTWDIVCRGYDAAAGTLNLHFGSELRTKTYKTVTANPFGDQVQVIVKTSFDSGVVLAGQNVYVNKISEGVFEISICSAPWSYSGSSVKFDLNARFISPL